MQKIIVEHYVWNQNVPLTPRDLGGVTDEIIHHSAGALTQTVQDIHAEHLAKDWHGIGYTFVIPPDGSIHTGTPIGDVPAATQGFNTISVAICLIGNFEKDDPGYTGPPTAAQLASLSDLSVMLHEKIPSIERTQGHRDYMPDACPGSELYRFLPELRAHVFAERQLGPEA